MTATPKATPAAAAQSATAAARQELFDRLTGLYPNLPVQAILNAVGEADRALLLCGTGEAEQAIALQVCRHNLDTLANALGRNDVRHITEP